MKFLLVGVLGFGILSSSFAVNLEALLRFVDAGHKEKIKQGELVSLIKIQKEPEAILLPNSPQIKKFSDFVSNEKGNLVLESIQFLPHVAQSPLELFNKSVQISKMTGTQYYSHRRKIFRVLIEEAYTIDDVKSKKPVPDRSFYVIPESEKIPFFQKDVTFGKGVYWMETSYDGASFLLKITNETAMNYGIVQAATPGTMHTFIFIIPCDEGLLLYGATKTLIPAVFGVEKRISTSLENRIIALLNWYKSQLGIPVSQQIPSEDLELDISN